ncbi:hypothetical protein STW0522PSE72_26690 [Pseudomonas monteilii]|nr:hypothetical protein STW0522PSE72_26690 [Pseudomonas monteilii]
MKSARKLFAMALAVSLVAPGYLLAATDTIRQLSDHILL